MKAIVQNVYGEADVLRLADDEVPSSALRSQFALPGVVVRPLEAGLRTGALTAHGRR